MVGLFVLVLVSSSLITDFQTAVLLAFENDCSLGASIIKQNTKQGLCVANHIRPLETKSCGVQLSKRVFPRQCVNVRAQISTQYGADTNKLYVYKLYCIVK